MRRHLVRAVGVVAMIAGFTGCFVAPVPVGAPVYEPYEPPAVVEGPPVTVWGFWPHYDVDHHYVVNHERVVIHDGRRRSYIRNEGGKHRGWYKHGNR